jgi:hypothetical protein
MISDVDVRVAAHQPSADKPLPTPPAEKTTGTIFHQEWMLDAASSGRWEQVELMRDGLRIAHMPFLRQRRLGTTRLLMPRYIRVLGPVLNLPDSKPVTLLANASKTIAELMGKLPPHAFFRQSLPPEFDYSTAFVMAGWNVHQDYTFRVLPGSSESTVLKNMHWRTRSHIRQSQQEMEVRQHGNLDLFNSLARDQAEALRRPSHHRFDLIEKIVQQATARGCATILTASTDADPNAGTAILLFDDHVLYFWQAARRVQTGNRAYTRLLWEAFRLAMSRNLTFDLDGFYSPSASNYLAAFGATPVARPWVNYYGLPHRAIRLAKDTWTGIFDKDKLSRLGLADHIAAD